MKHRLIFLTFPILAAVVLFTSCGRDPEKAKRRYVENGNRYAAQGKWKEAIIMYRNAIKKDPRFGEAYLKLGDAEMRRGGFNEAVGAYRRAVELLPDPDEPAGKLADIYLAAFVLGPKKDPRLLREVQDLAASLAAKNPRSYQALRLNAFLNVADQTDKTQEHLFKAIEYFKKADAVKPRQPELRLAMIQTMAQVAQFDEAEKYALEVLQDSPKYASAYWFLTRLYLQRNRLKDADAVMDRLIANNPGTPVYQVDKAEYLFLTQRKDEAVKILTAVASGAGVKADILKRSGDAYMKMRDPQRAFDVYASGIQKFPDQKTEFRLKMIPALLALNKRKEAIELAETAVREEPSNNGAVSMRASLWLNFGSKEQFDTAVKDLQTLISREPKNAVVRYNLGRAYQSRGDLDAARAQFQEAVKISRYLTNAHLGLGQIAMVKQDFGKAITSADEVLAYDPGNVAARILRINALTSNGNTNQARIDVNNYLKDTPDNADLKFQLAIINFVERRYKEAEEQFRALYRQYPNDLRLLFSIAEVLLRTNRQAEAMRLVEEAQQKNPDNPGLKLAVGNVAMRLGQLDQAERQYRALLAADPKNVDLMMRLGETLRRKGQVQQAVEILKQGYQLSPAFPGVALQLALTYEAAGDWRQALPVYEGILKQDPNHLIALNNVAYRYADMGKDLDAALNYAQRAKQRAPTNDDVADTLAWVYIRKNLNDSAITVLKPLIAKQPRNPLFHFHLGLALLQKGERTAARQSLQTALSLNPSKEDETRIREALAKVG